LPNFLKPIAFFFVGLVEQPAFFVLKIAIENENQSYFGLKQGNGLLQINKC